MSQRSLSRLSPVETFQRVTMRQDVSQRCFDVDPNTVRAGEDQDLTVTVELENTIDGDRDHVWRIEVDGEGLGFKTTTVPAGQTVTDDQTRTIPADRLPTGGGTVDVVIQQIGGRQQTSRCGILEVLPAETEPTIDPRLVGFDGCGISPRLVAPGESFDLEVALTNENPLNVPVDIVWSVDGGPILQLPGQTVPAETIEHHISGETTPELAGILPGQTLGVFVSVTNLDLGIAFEGSCGTISVTGGFDEADVFVPENQCTVSPLEITPPQDVALSATVINDTLFPAIAEVAWLWQGVRIASAEVSVDAEAKRNVQASATIQRQGRGQVRAEVVRASGGVA